MPEDLAFGSAIWELARLKNNHGRSYPWRGIKLGSDGFSSLYLNFPTLVEVAKDAYITTL